MACSNHTPSCQLYLSQQHRVTQMLKMAFGHYLLHGTCAKTWFQSQQLNSSREMSLALDMQASWFAEGLPMERGFMPLGEELERNFKEVLAVATVNLIVACFSQKYNSERASAGHECVMMCL